MELPKIPDHESERLKALQSYDILDTLEEEDFNNLAKLASEICQTPISVISFVDSNRQWFKSAVGLNAKETSRDISFCGHAINNSNDILIIEDARNDLRFNDNPLVTGDPNIVFYAGTPLVDENGMALGTLCVIDSVPRKLSSAQLNTLQILSKSIVDLLKIRRQTKMIEKEKLFLIESLEFSSPYFLIVDKNGIITEFGKNYKKSIQSLQKNMLFSDVFNWISKIDFEQINDSFQYQNKLLFFETKDKKQKYKCSIKISFDNKYILCVVPVINTEYPISNFKININDFPKQDYIAEYLFLQQAATRGLEDSKRLNDLLNIKNKDLEISKNALIEANNVLEKRIFERTNTIKNLALFPEQNPNPVFEIDFVNENLIYINPAAKDIFGFDLKSDFLEVCSAIHLNKQNYHLPAINKNEFQFNDLVFQYNIFIVKGQETARIYLHNITEIRTIEKEEKAKQEILLQFRSIDHSLNFSEKIKIINSTSANFLNVDRCSIWFFDEQNTSITSNSIYLKEKNKQSEGLTFLSSDYPRYFKNVLNEPFLFASDAHVHPATSEFSETYLKPLGITSTLDIPIMNSGFIIGVICNEYFTKKDNYTASELNFMRSVADSVALIFESEKVISSKEELKRKNDSLTDAYEKLIEMQSEIIKQDKLATLGTLIAGIAHEVNTPLGAIKASNDSINQALANNFNFNLEEINQEELALVFQLTNTRIKTTKQLSTRDERILIKTISEELIQKFPTMNDPQFYAKKITEFGYHTADSCFDLFIKHKKASQFFEMASNLVNLARSSDNILLAVNKASRVVKSLNLFSHTNSSKERQNFKLKENFENVETILWNRIKNGSNLVINIDDDLEIFGNPDEISQVWTNIINNAIQACDSKAEILIQYRKEDNYHTIIIENNGPKIPNEVINKIFDPFFSTKKRGEGTGLGLHIVKKIIDNHNGEIVCKSSDLSTQFIIKLPVK
jgi:signal transduction histidine kinase